MNDKKKKTLTFSRDQSDIYASTNDVNRGTSNANQAGNQPSASKYAMQADGDTAGKLTILKPNTVVSAEEKQGTQANAPQKDSNPGAFTFAHTPSPIGGDHHTMLPGASDRINSTLNPLLNPNKPTSAPIPGIQVDGTALYDYYRDLYEQQGRLAKEDAEGKVAAATGGQASSYADTAGGQTYDAYLAEYDAILRDLAGDRDTENTDNWYSEMFGEGEPAFTGTSKAEAEAYLASLDIPADALAELIPPAKWARLKRAGGEAAETQFNSYAEYLSAFVEYVLDTYEG